MEEIEIQKTEDLTLKEKDEDCGSEKSDTSVKLNVSQASEEEVIDILRSGEVTNEEKVEDKKRKKGFKHLINWKKKTEENGTKSSDASKNPFHAEMGEPDNKREKYASFNSVMNRVSSSTTRILHSLNKTFSRSPGDTNEAAPGCTIIPVTDVEGSNSSRSRTMTLGRVFNRRGGKPKDSLEELNLEGKTRTLGRRIALTIRAPFKQQQQQHEDK